MLYNTMEHYRLYNIMEYNERRPNSGLVHLQRFVIKTSGDKSVDGWIGGWMTGCDRMNEWVNE